MEQTTEVVVYDLNDEETEYYLTTRASMGFNLIQAVALAELIGILIYFLAPVLIGAFDSTPEVIAYGTMQAHTEALFYGLLALAHAVAAVCRGAGKAFVPMLIMLSVWCVFRIGYIYFVMHLYGQIRYIYAAYPLTWGISDIIYIIYYLRSDWMKGFEGRR